MGMWLLKKIEKFITLINRLVDEPMIYIAFRKQHPCPFHFHLFCFEANINIQFLELHHPFRDTYCSIIQVFFHYFCLKFVCRLTNIGTFISCLFLGGTYFKSMFCWHKYVSSESRLTGQNLFGIFNTCYIWSTGFPILNKTTMVEK